MASGRVCTVDLLQFCTNWFGGRYHGKVRDSLTIHDVTKTVSFENCGITKETTYSQPIGCYKGKWDSSRGQNELTNELKSMVKKMLFAHKKNVLSKYPQCGDRGTRALIYSPEKKRNTDFQKAACTTSLDVVRGNRKGEFKALCVE